MDQSNNRKKVNVIIGNSAAAVSAIKAIRKYDKECKIILISKEYCNAYSPVLTTYLISEQIDSKGMFIVDDNFYKEYNVTTLLGTIAVKVDPIESQVQLENGEKVEFDNLLIATGSTPKKLGVDGEDLPGIFTLKSMSDAERILEYSKGVKDIVVIGGGLIGLQATKGLHKKGRKNTTMLIGSNQILSQSVDEKCSRLLEATIREAGVLIKFNTNIKSILKENNSLKIQLDSGEEMESEMIVIGKGVNPNIDLVKNSQIKTNRGILVDEGMRTNYPNIFAAGDVAEGPNLLTGKKRIVSNWINACEQGTVAGSNMTGQFSTYENQGENITNIFGLIVSVLGNSKPVDEDTEKTSYFDYEKRIYRKIHFNEKGEIDGAILVGRASDVGIISNLIRRHVVIPMEVRKMMACNVNALSLWYYRDLNNTEIS